MNADEENRSRLSGLFERVAAAKDRRIAVMGSMNVDYTVVTERLPQPGETVTGGPLQVLPGGKSANQAAAAGRLGAGVTMLGMVGSDDSGAFLIDQLKDARVDTSSIAAMEGPSGSTVITVDAAGENTIVYSAGANAQVSVDYVTSHSQAIQSAAVLGLLPHRHRLLATGGGKVAGLRLLSGHRHPGFPWGRGPGRGQAQPCACLVCGSGGHHRLRRLLHGQRPGRHVRGPELGRQRFHGFVCGRLRRLRHGGAGIVRQRLAGLGVLLPGKPLRVFSLGRRNSSQRAAEISRRGSSRRGIVKVSE